jgi:hypothetical protein
MYEAMLLGYAQVEANYQGDYLNRVILLSGGRDGNGVAAYDKTAFLEMSGWYNQQGIDTSTIALGMESDIDLMADIAAVGGGAFRLIPDVDMMAQTFGSDLDRLVVPAVWQLELELTLAPGLRFREAWGYNYWVEDSVMHFGLGPLHNGDSKTVVAIADLTAFSGNSLGTYSLIYTDTQGKTWRTGPFDLPLASGALQNRRALTEPRLRDADVLLTLGKNLIDIGSRAWAIVMAQAIYGNYQNDPYDEGPYGGVMPEATSHKRQIAAELENCLNIIQSTWDYLANISNNTGGGKYARELRLLEDYEYAFNQFYSDHLSY